MRGTRYPNAEEHPPQPPFKGGRAVKRKNLCEDLSPASLFVINLCRDLLATTPFG